MPQVDEIVYRTQADILSGGNTLEFHMSSPERLAVRISATEDILRYIQGYPFRVPEQNALFLFPAFKEKFLQIVKCRHMYQLRSPELPVYVLSHIFSHGNLPELLDLIRTATIDDSEKLRAYMAFCQQNIFANREVPTSFRLISDAAGLSSDRILQLVREDCSETFVVVAGQFLIPARGIDI